MALYEYLCSECGARTERRMSMSDVLQFVPCAKCGKQARKIVGNFAIVGRSEPGLEDGPAPWDDGAGGDDLDAEDDFGHGHSHGPGGHTH